MNVTRPSCTVFRPMKGRDELIITKIFVIIIRRCTKIYFLPLSTCFKVLKLSCIMLRRRVFFNSFPNFFSYCLLRGDISLQGFNKFDWLGLIFTGDFSHHIPSLFNICIFVKLGHIFSPALFLGCFKVRWACAHNSLYFILLVLDGCR